MFKIKFKKIKEIPENITYLNKYFTINRSAGAYKVVAVFDHNIYLVVWLEDNGRIEGTKYAPVENFQGNDKTTYDFIENNDVRIPQQLKNYIYVQNKDEDQKWQ